MPTDDVQIQAAGTAPAPLDYRIPGAGMIQPKAVTATFDGTAAVVPFLPILKIISDSGMVVAQCKAETVSAGGQADVSWFPHVGGAGAGGLQRFLGARIQATNTQVVADTTNTDLHYQGVYFDTDGMANLGADDRILTVNTAGLYIVACETIWQWKSPSAGRRINVAIHNGFYSGAPIPPQFQTSDSRMAIWQTDGTGGPTPYTTNTSVGLFRAAAGDFFSSGCYQASGVNQTANGLSNCFLSALLVGV